MCLDSQETSVGSERRSALDSLQLLEGVVGHVDPSLVAQPVQGLKQDLSVLVGAITRLELRIEACVLMFDGDNHGVVPDGSKREVSCASRHALVANKDRIKLERESVIGQHGGDHQHMRSGPYAGGLAVDLTTVECDVELDVAPAAHGLQP